ncbi:hypothetical protein JXM67_05440 [candidate division WOR-3 bacterium]|nr:hypothetical protein [candidate division WOR-3 bacterium]
MRKLLSIMLVLGMTAIPVLSYADDIPESEEIGKVEENTVGVADDADACLKARHDAEKKVQGMAWFALGCLMPVVGIIASYVVEPRPSGLELLGKSPEYVAAYTDCYEDKGRSIQIGNAWLGCASGCLVNVLLYAAYIGFMSLVY